jgi:hypothetical protein
MTDIWTVMVAVSTALSAVFLFLSWYNRWQEKRDKVFVTRFMENNQWFVRVTPKFGMLDECTVAFDNQELLGKITISPVNIIRGSENFQFWANNVPSNLDDREVLVKNRGKTIYKRKFRKLIRES